MFLDNALLLSNAQAITSTAASTTLYDVTGAGSGNVPSMVFGTTGLAGVDLGLGEGMARPNCYFTVGTTFTAGGAATLTIQIQLAPDNGSGSPGTYVTLAETGAIAVGSLVAGKNFSIPLPPLSMGEAVGRFYRFNYVVATGPFTAGTLTGCILLDAASPVQAVAYPANFTSV